MVNKVQRKAYHNIGTNAEKMEKRRVVQRSRVSTAQYPLDKYQKQKLYSKQMDAYYEQQENSVLGIV